jgi:drug/metabolite transporter (DMT)-like permease
VTSTIKPAAAPGTVAWASAAFVPLWSSGVVFGALALRHGPPFAVTALRFAAAAILLIGLALVRRAVWPRGAALGHAAMTGLLLQGAHYAGIYAGLAAGLPAGVTGLVVGLIPVVTAIGAVPMLGERFTARRAAASIFGVLSAALVTWSQLGIGSGAAMGLGALALFSGAGAALWQKRFGGTSADVPSAAIQLLAGTAVMTLCWLALERGGPGIHWSAGFLLPFAWLIVANSVGATLLLLWLLARGAAGRVTGLFFLVPPVTALAAAPLLDEWPSATALIAIVLGAAAVRLLMTER